MNSLLRGVLALSALTPILLSAQGDTAPVRKTGTIYKDEVDTLIRVVRETAARDGLPALGGESVAATAKVLSAMAHCHRFYDLNAGPAVRPSLQFLIKNRKADGSFGDQAATAWTIDALNGFDADGYRDEVAQARKWLAANGGGAEPGLQSAVAAVIEQVRADVFPEHLAAGAKKQVWAWYDAPQRLDRGVAADALVALVACQIANRQLDKQGAQEPKAGVFSPAQQKAFDWLLTQQKDGVFSVMGRGGKSAPDAGFTAFGLLGLQTKPKALRSAAEQATIEKGITWLLAQQQEDGSFDKALPNYVTCAAVAALVRSDNPACKPALQKAQKLILGFQNIESSGYERKDADYGSIGYGNSQRGDLSNLHFSLETLRDTGLPADHEAFQKALVFLQRTQNLKATNDFSGKVKDPDREGQVLDSTSGDDGGSSYYPGNSAAGYLVQPDGKSVPRSYGSMTYALLKSYTLAGLSGDDVRVQGAVKWIQNNWDLATNPGSDPALGEKVKYQGLFYYYMVLAQALDLAGLQNVKVPGKPNEKGEATTTELDWRKALRSHLEGMQKEDGTWVNSKNGRWYENMPMLCTCYALIALERCR
ncbi:MAG: terpene cyclase/mutase family protein [Planctomycetes bacterium]|nr:terpene cyclase/mutase family protein [Planctomycetota bacterium]